VARLENRYSPRDLERAIVPFVGYHNQKRAHEAIGNLTPNELYHERRREISSRRERIKCLTLEMKEERESTQRGLGARSQNGIA
jgi:hypothetical protein